MFSADPITTLSPHTESWISDEKDLTTPDAQNIANTLSDTVALTELDANVRPPLSAINSEPNAYADDISQTTLLDPTNTTPEKPIHLVVIDGQVHDIESLLADITIPDNATLETLVLNPNQDGLLQLTDTLSDLENVSTVHIVSHGANGVWELGQAQVTVDNIDAYQSQLGSWRSALNNDADILLYGCDLAASESGIDLLEVISDLTGADIAASTDDTGNKTLNGDWDLEFTIGEIQSAVAFSDVTFNNWNSTLAISANLIGHWTLNGNVIDSSSIGNDGIFLNPFYELLPDGTQAANFANDPATNNLSYIEIPGNTAYSATTGDFTISFWFDRTSITPQSDLFLAKNGIDYTRLYLGSGDSIYWSVHDSNGSTATLWADIPDSGWTLITATRTGDNFQLYVNDGPADGNQTQVNVNADLANANITLGAANATNFDFDGHIKDVRIYDSALSESDNDELFTNAPLPTAEPPILSINAPNTTTINEDTTLDFTGADTIQVDDGLTNNSLIHVAISVQNGTLNLPGTSGVSFISGTNNSDNVVIHGRESNINVALAGMQFTPDINYSGSTTLTIELGLNSHLKGYYTFESGDVSDTSYGNFVQHGTLVGEATVTNDVDRGNVLTLDGIDDHATIPSAFGQPNSIAIGGWVNLAAGSGPTEFISIDNRVLIRLDQASGVNAYFADTTTTWEGLTSGIHIAGTGWRHVFYSVNAGSSHTLYIDGIAVASAPTTSYINWGSAAETQIGYHPGDNYMLNGSVDNIRIHNHPVFADEVLAYFHETETVSKNIQLEVLAVDDPPIIDLDANNSTVTGTNYAGNFVEANGPIGVTDTDVSITDIDSIALTSATLTITNLLDGVDESLSVTVPDSSWTSSYNSSQGTLTVLKPGGAPFSDWVNVYESIQYNNTSQDPNTATRIITVEGQTGATANNPLATASIEISPINNAPVIAIGGNPITTVGGTIPITAAILSEGDPDDNGYELTYTVTSISNGTLRLINTGATVTSFTPDEIGFNNLEFVHDGLSTQNGVVELTLTDGGEDGVSAASDTLIITVIGALPDLYATNEDSDLNIGTNSGLLDNDTQSAGASVVSIDDSMTNGTVTVNPDGSFLYLHNGVHDYLSAGQSATDSFDYTYDDGNGNQQTVTATINIDGLNDPPVLRNLENTMATYVENSTGVALTNNLEIVDVDNNQFQTATVSITNNHVASEDLLALASQPTITSSYSSATGTLTLTGPASASDFETALRAVTYQNTNNNTSTLTRTIEFSVNDGNADSTPVSRELEILPINDPPIIAINTGVNSIVGATTVITGTMLNEADPDDDSAELTYTAASVSNGQLELISNPGVAITTFTQLDIDSNNVIFVHDGLSIQDGSFDITLADGGENLVEQLLSQDSTLSYDAVTDKFYRFIDTPVQFSQALSAATTDQLNGVAGQLITIGSAYENQILHDWVISSGNQIWMGASDATNEGDWNWLSGSTESTQTFWTGGSAGSAVPGYYVSTMNLSEVAGEDYLRMIDNGRWNDQPNSGPHSYVVEWDASSIPVLTDNDTFTVTVTGALPDAYNINEDITSYSATPATGLLANDSTGTAPFVVSTDTTNTVGSVTVNADGTFTYSPQGQFAALNVGQTATDTFDYTYDDGTGVQQTVTVTITLNGVNDAPTLSNIELTNATYIENAPATILTNTLSLADVDNTQISTATISISNNFYTAEDLLTFNDQLGITGNYDSSSGVLTLTGPASKADFETAIRSIGYVNNSDDPTLAARTIEFIINDGAAASVAEYRNIEIQPINDAPVMTNNIGANSTVGGTAAITTALLNEGDLDDDGIELTYTASSLLNGQLELIYSPGVAVNSFTQADIDNGDLVFVHDGLTANNGSFDFSLADGGENGATPAVGSFIIDITGALPDAYTTDEDTALNITSPGLLANDSSPATSSVSSIDTTNTIGSVLHNPDGSFSFQPNGAFESLQPGQTATDTFTYTFDDGFGYQQSIDVTITINGINDAPLLATNTGASASIGGAVAITTAMLNEGDLDDDGIELTYTVSSIANGQLELINNPGVAVSSFTQADIDNGNLAFIHDGLTANNGSFDFSLADGGENSAAPAVDSFIIDIAGALPDAYITDEDTTLNITAPGLLANDSSTATSSVTSIDTTNTLGSALHNTDGSFSYQPQGVFDSLQPGQTATDTFSYTFDDGHGYQQNADVTITINGINDAPLVTNNIGTSTTVGGAAAITTAMLNEGDLDDDGIELTYIASSILNGQLEFINNPGAAITSFTQADIDNGNLVFIHDGLTATNGSFDYSLADGGENNAAPAVGSFNIEIAGALPDAYFTDEDTTLNITAPGLLANDSSPATSSVTSIDTTNTLGSVLHNTDGSFSYQPQGAFDSLQPGQTATDTFSYTFDDGFGYQQSVDVTISIAGINDAPTLSPIETTPAPYVENSTLIITNTLSLADLDDTQIETATISISNNFVDSEDELNFTDQLNIVGNYSALTGVLTLTGPASKADFETAIRTVTYSNNSDTPTGPTREIEFVINDGNSNSNERFRAITILEVNDPPVVATNTGASVNVGASTIITAAMLNEGDLDDDGSELTYTVSNALNGQLELSSNTGAAISSFTQADINAGNIIFVHDGLSSSNGSFDFTLADGGEDNAAPATDTFIINVVGALPDAYTTDENTTLNVTAPGLLANDSNPATANVASIDTTNTAGTVLHNADGSFSYQPQGVFESLQLGQTATDTFSYTFNDGFGYQQSANVTISVSGRNDAPTLNSAEPSQLTYLENSSLTLTNDLTLADADDTQIDSATISISNNFNTAEDTLNFTDQLGINGNYDTQSGVLTLTGPATVADFETAIRTVTYSNNSDTPSTLPRQVEFVITDGDSNSNVLTRDIDVVTVNDAPVIATNTGAISLVGDRTTITTAMLNEGDVDDNGIGLTYSASTINNGQLELGSNPGVAITSFTQSEIDSNLVVFVHDGQSIDNGSFDITLSDGGEDGASAATDTFTISVTGALPDSYSTNEDTTLNIAANGLLANDTAGTSAFVASIDTSNTVGAVISNPDGSFSYQPDGAFESLNAGQTVTDTFAYTYDNGQGIQQTANVSIDILGVNDAPVISSPGTTLTYYTEGGASVELTDSFLLTDIDNSIIESAQISISNNFNALEDNLGFNPQQGITGSYDQNSGILTLTGPASITDFETAISTIAYSNTSTDPSILTRTLSIAINDGETDSNTLYRDIEIIPFNNPPVIAINTGANTTVGGTVTITGAMLNEADPDDDNNELTYTATANNGQLELTNNPGMAVNSFTQADINSENVIFIHNGLTNQNGSFTLSLADGGENNAAAANDTFIVAVTGPLPDNYTTDEDTILEIPAAGLLTNDSLSAGAFVAGIDSTSTLGTVTASADGSFTYHPNNAFDALNTGQTIIDTFDYIYDDGNGNIQTAQATINIQGVNDAPAILNVETAPATYNENNAPVELTNNLTITDSDHTLLNSATVSITGNFSPNEDILSYSSQNPVTGSYNASTGVLTLTGPATSAEFETAIRSITYHNTSDSPSDLARTITFVVNDSASDSATVTREITIIPSNDSPLLAAIESIPVSYTENDLPTPITNSLSITDIDNNTLDSAVVTIDSGFSAGEDILNFSSQSGITGTYNPFNGTLTLTGTATVSDYETALQSITYENTSDNPTTQIRTIGFTVADSTENSSKLSRDIHITSTNDAPILSGIEPFATSYIENSPAIQITDSVILSDLDHSNIESAKITLRNNHITGEDTLLFTDLPGISGLFNPTDGTLTLTGSASIADYQTAFKSIRYQNVSENPSPLVRTVDFYISDGGAVSNIGARDIEVVSVNDSPQGTDTSVTILEDSSYTVDLEDFGFSDPLDNNTIQGIVISDLPDSGTLSLAGSAVNTGQLITTTDITAGKLVFEPAPNENGMAYSNLRFLVVDDGGIENNGSNTATTASELTFNVTSVNDAPSGTDKTVSIPEDTSYTFTQADFGFTDLQDTDQFIALTIITLPEDGTFTLDNAPVSAGTIINIADIDGGKLQYTPPANANGPVYTGFSVLVHDSGGNSNNDSFIAKNESYINFDIQSINDAPVLISEGMTIDEGGYRIIETGLLTATDADNNASELTFTLNSNTENGTLTLLGVPLNTGDTFTLEQLQENLIYYTHDGSETNHDHFDIQVGDTGEDGTLPVTGRFNITINEVIDPAPTIDNESFALQRGQTFNTSAGDQLASGAIALASTPLSENPLLTIAIESYPTYGTVTINEDGTFTYLHDGSTNYSDSFSYRVTNQDGIAAIATVSVSIEPGSTEPALASAISSVPDSVTPLPVETEIEETEEIPVEEAATPEEETTASAIDLNLIGTAEIAAYEGTPYSESATVIQIQNELNENDTVISPSAYKKLTELEVKKHNNIKFALIDDQNITLTTNTIQVLTDVTVTRVSEVVSNKNFLDGLQQFEQDLEESDTKEKRRYNVATDTAIGISLSTTAGVLAWALRGGALFASLMASTPLWSNVDPVRVIGDKLNNSKKQASTDKVEQYFED